MTSAGGMKHARISCSDAFCCFGLSDVMEQRCVLFSLNMWVKGASEKFKEVFNSFDGSVVSG